MLLSPRTWTPLNQRRWANFKANKRGFWSLWVFLLLFGVSLCAEFVANDHPLLVSFDGHYYMPVFFSYPETKFGGSFETEARYRDPYVQKLIDAKGWMLWPPIRFSYNTINYDLQEPAPSPPSRADWLGTDDQGRDVLARVIYGFRISVLFGLTLTVLASAVGITAGAVQGYFGGLTDLTMQRFIEIWGGLPEIYLLIILSSLVQPTFASLLVLLLLLSWTSLVSVVRAEFLRARNLDYVRAAKAMGAPDRRIIFKYLLPNAMVATISRLPFVLTHAITILTTLDFLGLGLPAGSPSLGELVNQGKRNLQAPWLGFSAFLTMAVMLSLLVFVSEAVRDAFDPRKINGGAK